MRIVLTVCLAALSFTMSGCGSPSVAGPAAPTGLAVAPLSGGAHLTWKDNSSNETEFMIERMAPGDAAFKALTAVPFNTVQYHDAAPPKGLNMYRVMAMGASGMSAYTSDVSITIP